jgi:putative ABC transport system permease protein
MLEVVWRGFFARKLRAVLTGIAIALGVALMAGTYILTDTINASFGTIFTTANRGNDVVVTPHQVFGREQRAQDVTQTPITDATLARVRGVRGVAEAAGSIFSTAALLDDSGRHFTTHAPSFVSSIVPKRFESFSVVRGRFPRSPAELSIDESTASAHHLAVGGTMQVAGRAAGRRYTIVGVVKFAGSASFGGAGVAVMTLPEAQRVAGEPGRYDQIVVAATPGVSPAQLRTRISAALPANVDVRTGAQQAAKQTSDIKANLGFLRTFLLIFAYVALFVGAFIIFNTFSITVAQRTREFGLLRALGATRAQLMGSVLGESVLLGLGGAALGLAGGLGLAPALNALFKSFGADLPHRGTVLEARTVIVSLAVGTVVTVVAAVAPAIRSTRVPPVAALREGVALPPGRLARYSLPARLGVLAVGIVVLVASLVGGGGAAAIGLGALVVFVGVALLSPRFVPPLARAVATPFVRRGVTGRLARENAIRQPGRTAVTSAALMIGVALVAFVSVLAAGFKASIDNAVDRSFAGDLIVENSQAQSDQGIPPQIASAVRHVPGVGTATPVAFTVARIGGISGNATVTAVDPATFGQVYRIDWKHGSNATLATLGTTGVIVTRGYADSHNLKVGRRLSTLTPSGRIVDLTVAGIASDNARLLGDLTITTELAARAFAQRDIAFALVTYRAGADGGRVKPVVDALLRQSFPQARARTAAQFKKDQASQVNTLLALIYVLLALAVIVSLFGIVNTLVLSIYERVRELGMMRAIGTSRRQVRAMIRYESIITALIGAVIGLVVGLLFAVVITRPLAADGFVLSVPVGTLVLLLVAAGLAGWLASAWPARRAAGIDMLDALTAE